MTLRSILSACALALAALAQSGGLVAAEPVWRHAAALIGEPKYAEGFLRFDYVNPDAPKGGTLRLSSTGSFDTLNPVPAKGDLATGLNLVYQSLMIASEDEVATTYGLIAESLSYPEDFSSVTYRLRETARWHDGEPITVEDVIWSYEQSIAHNPQRQFYYQHVSKVEKTGDREVTFTFDETNNRELPKIVGELLILPKHWWEAKRANGTDRTIAETTLEPVMGSGPYRIAAVDPGSTVTFERVEDHWGEDLNVYIGQNNFDRIVYSYFGDRSVEFEAFKANNLDYWEENEAKRWASSYDFPAVTDGRIKREMLENRYRSSGVLVGFVMNVRREKFQDVRVREALKYAYDFEEQNRTIFYDQYVRINSYFFGTELASTGLPEGRELELLEAVRAEVPEKVFTTPYENPVNGSPQNLRTNLGKAVELFKAAGFELRGSRMVNAQTGEPFRFEILLNGPIIEKVALHFAQNLKRIGIEVSVRPVDQPSYINRWRSRDFDVVYTGWGQSLSPGNEQSEYWGSQSAGRDGSSNYVGVNDPAIDKLVRNVVFAKDRDELVAAARALDRVLLANHFVVPSYTIRSSRIAYWDKLVHPDTLPMYEIGFPGIWWARPSQ